jgi:hypothetical protein
MRSHGAFKRSVARAASAALAAMMACTVLLAQTGAVTVIYDFESPQFTTGELTPMLERAPSPGSSFRTDFGEAAIAGAFSISPFVPNVLFTGQSLIGIAEPNAPLRLTFNQPVTRLQLSFAVEQSGRLELISPLGSIVEDSGPAGGPYEGGALVLLAPGGVFAVQLDAFTDDGRPNLWGLDNLRLEVVPEPSASFLAIGAIAGICLRRFRCLRPSANPPTEFSVARNEQAGH